MTIATSNYLNHKPRTLARARIDQFMLGAKYAQLIAAGKSTDGILKKAKITPAQASLNRIVARYKGETQS